MNKEEGLKLIRPGSIISVKTIGQLNYSNLLQKAILLWAKYVERLDHTANHSALYWGSGRHEIIEANGGKVRIRTVDQFLKPYNRVYFFHNINTTVENLAKAKAEAYGRVFVRKGLDIKGRLYDWKEFLRFINPKIKDDPNADICSRLVWDIEKIKQDPIVDEDKYGRISPARIIDYLMERQDGWACSVIWNGDTFVPGS